MEYMFYDCKNLNNSDLSDFNMENVNNVDDIFHGWSQKKIK